VLIPSIGGPERQIAQITGSSVAWTPDAKWLAFADGQPASLYLLSLATGERRRLTIAAAGSDGDDAPVFSTDGRRLAFERHSTIGFGDIYTLALTADFRPVGAPLQMTRTGQAWSPVWTAAGDLVFTINWRLTRMPATPGAEPTPVVDESGSDAAISRQGNRLAYTHSVTDRNIWRGRSWHGWESP
jgi:Tol biopolymer transport system component